SPTPTVPISSDSIRRMAHSRPSVLARAAAAIQPALPPPTMTMLLIRESATEIESATERPRLVLSPSPVPILPAAAPGGQYLAPIDIRSSRGTPETLPCGSYAPPVIRPLGPNALL